MVDGELSPGAVRPIKDEVEGASLVLWLSRADEGEAVAPGHLWPLRPPEQPSIWGTERDVGLHKHHWG